MPSLYLESDRLAQLRERAVAHLDLPEHPSRSRADPAQALTALIDLAAVPSTAHKALALLHELQVHQVELELQNEDLRQTTATLEAALRAEQARFHSLPVACAVVDDRLMVQAVSDPAAAWLGVPAQVLAGDALLAHLTPDSALALQALLASGGADARWTLAPHGQAAQAVRVRVTHDRAAGTATLAWWADAAAT